MYGGALIFIITWHYSLAELQSGEANGNSISDFQLLIPLLVPGEKPIGRMGDSREDDEKPFSSIPAYAFTLDNELSAAPIPVSSVHPALRLGEAIPRSIYLEGDRNNAESEAVAVERELRRACSRLDKTHEILLLLCAELLDTDIPKPRAVLPQPAHVCPCCGAVVSARRHHGPIGDSVDMVQRYVEMARKKRNRERRG